jgi:transposase
MILCMSLTSKSPQDVAREALAAGAAALARFSHKFSPKTFTQPQLLACLMLRKLFRTDYRGIAAILQDHAELRGILGLVKVPHFTTLHKASLRLLSQPQFRTLLAQTLRRVLRRRKRIKRAAADSSGFACGHASRYYVRRRAKGQSREEKPAQQTFYQCYAKLEAVFDTATHLAVGALAVKGPAPDVDRLVPLLKEAQKQVRLKILLADAGFDSESNHLHAREHCGIRTLMPARHGRRSSKPPSGYWRRRMRGQLATKTKRRRSGYSQRSQAETGFSMIKRRQGESVSARKFQSQCRELRLMVLVHNVMISHLREGFLQSPPDPFIGELQWRRWVGVGVRKEDLF